MIDYLVVKIVCGTFCVLRWLFLSSRAGKMIHNFIFYNFLKLADTDTVEDVARIFREATRGNHSGNELLKRIYCLTPVVRKRMVENIFGWGFIGILKRKMKTRQGLTVPISIMISPTYRCNLKCKGCYARDHEGELPFDDLDRIIAEHEKLGGVFVAVLGGEPFLRNDLWQIYKRHPRIVFSIYTNGTLVGKEEIEEIARLGNIRLAVALRGFQENTDARRGNGTYEKITSLLKLCQRANIAYTVAVVVDRDNYQEVVSKRFVEEIIRLGSLAVSYGLYQACSSDGDPSLMISAKQAEELNQWGENMRNHYPAYFFLGKGGSDIVTYCSAAKLKIHITANGDIEPCIFCHWAADNIKDKSISEAMESRFFQLIRGFNVTKEAVLNPCYAVRSTSLQDAFQKIGAYPTIKIDEKGG